jgi:peptidoglycan hydrolase-like protein with peptidoglycan-binding domain
LPKRNSRQSEAAVVESGALVAAIMRNPREFVGIVMAVAATVMIFVNAMFLQHGPHPAPILATRPATVPETSPAGRAQLVAEIQGALADKGFYDGTIDGVWGGMTDAALRDFAQAAGLSIRSEANGDLLRTIRASKVRAPRVNSTSSDPIARLLAPSKRVVAVQRALSDFGYGQVKPTGIPDPATRAAIEKFERDHRLPVTGQVSDQLVRALAAMTGRPLE